MPAFLLKADIKTLIGKGNRRHGKLTSDNIKELVATDVFLATKHER